MSKSCKIGFKSIGCFIQSILSKIDPFTDTVFSIALRFEAFLQSFPGLSRFLLEYLEDGFHLIIKLLPAILHFMRLILALPETILQDALIGLLQLSAEIFVSLLQGLPDFILGGNIFAFPISFSDGVELVLKTVLIIAIICVVLAVVSAIHFLQHFLLVLWHVVTLFGLHCSAIIQSSFLLFLMHLVFMEIFSYFVLDILQSGS